MFCSNWHVHLKGSELLSRNPKNVLWRIYQYFWWSSANHQTYVSHQWPCVWLNVCLRWEHSICVSSQTRHSHLHDSQRIWSATQRPSRHPHRWASFSPMSMHQFENRQSLSSTGWITVTVCSHPCAPIHFAIFLLFTIYLSTLDMCSISWTLSVGLLQLNPGHGCCIRDAACWWPV